MNAFCKCLLSSAAAFAFALAPASAQRVPEEFTLSGDAAQRLGDYVSINAATAERLSDTCFETIQREANAASATIVILNAQGLTVHQVVKDGQRYTSVKITENKARTALMMRVPTIENMHDVAEDPLQLARYDQIGGLAPPARWALAVSAARSAITPSPCKAWRRSSAKRPSRTSKRFGYVTNGNDGDPNSHFTLRNTNEASKR